MVERYNISDMELAKRNKKKSGFNIKKVNTMKSLQEVEMFLRNWKKAMKGIRIYKALK